MYQKTFSKIVILFVVLMLSACGGETYDCSNSEVKDTLKQFMHVNGADEWMDRAYDGTTIRQVATHSKDVSTGTYVCSAVFEYKDNERTVTSPEVSYIVRRVEDEDSSFTVESQNVKEFGLKVVLPWAEEKAIEQRAAAEAQWEAERPAREAKRAAELAAIEAREAAYWAEQENETADFADYTPEEEARIAAAEQAYADEVMREQQAAANYEY